jgi:hypothetical protein
MATNPSDSLEVTVVTTDGLIFGVSAPITVVATFTITASAVGTGTITPSGAVVVNYGSDTTFTITPNAGAHLDSLIVDGVNHGSDSTSYTFTNVTANHTIVGYFSINTYTITASAVGTGTITPSGAVVVNYGSDTTFTITPNTGSHLDSLVVDNVNNGPDSTEYKFTNVTADHTINAYFSITPGIDEGIPLNLIVTTLNAPKPNPVTNGLARISFSIAEPSRVALKIYDASGKIVKTLVNNQVERGIYNLTWDGKDEHNRSVAEGIYFYTLETPKQNFTRKMIFTR